MFRNCQGLIGRKPYQEEARAETCHSSKEQNQRDRMAEQGHSDTACKTNTGGNDEAPSKGQLFYYTPHKRP